MKVKVLISDLQVPYHDERAVNNLSKFIHAFKPDDVASVGDEMDMQTISRWSQGTPLEYERSIGKDRDKTVAVLEKLKVTHMTRSNHTDRLYNSIMKRLPGLLGAPEFELENFLKLDQLGITYHKDPWEIAPKWLLLHGDEGSVNQTGGQTALGLAKRTGMSVVCGHTHRAGLLHYTESYGGKTNRTIWGMEVGNLMKQNQASYLKGGIANWQQAFGILYIDGNKVTPQLVPIQSDGTFVVDGRIWGK
jgi:hypothetical protein